MPLGARVRVTRRLKADAVADAKAAAINAANAQAESAARALERLEHGTAARDAEIVALKEVIRARGGAPDDLQCPISQELMRDPVVAADGRTYERAQIVEWYRGHDTSPMTNERLDSKHLFSNDIARERVRQFIDDCRASGTNPDSVL